MGERLPDIVFIMEYVIDFFFDG
ncbi:uncharacterized protein METZ01_LOCUS75258 [marine metagenome]|uniref:Uncharacterized protein n=1 Tax=marine metagenome TaxID=408172 RepID=A0A381U2W1_9ZZZZ